MSPSRPERQRHKRQDLRIARPRKALTCRCERPAYVIEDGERRCILCGKEPA